MIIFKRKKKYDGELETRMFFLQKYVGPNLIRFIRQNIYAPLYRSYLKVKITL